MHARTVMTNEQRLIIRKSEDFNIMKKRILIAAFTAAAMTVAALSGCSNSAKPAETSAQAETADKADANDTETKDAESKEQASDAAKDEKKDLREVNVVLDWYPNAIHTFLYTAIERGYYEEEGLDVQIRFPANANDALSMVAAGKAAGPDPGSGKPEGIDPFHRSHCTVSAEHHPFPEG